jgi:hypothetical protein
MRLICSHCHLSLPGGCLHIFGSHEQCKVGPRIDMHWRVGLAIWADLTDRRGIKEELNNLDLETKVELIESIGLIAIRAVEEYD